MSRKLNVIVKPDGKWFVAHYPEIPAANGQGKTVEEAVESLKAAVALILEDERDGKGGE